MPIDYNTLLSHCFEERKAGRGTPTQFSLLRFGSTDVWSL
jgi:hypothetical protein